MGFWSGVWNHKVKIIGVILAVHSQLMIELALYAMDGFVSGLTLRLVGSIGTLFSVAVAAAGWMNTTRERVAQAAATVAVAEAATAASMESALNTPPPAGGK
jgi:hypothetical protein